jgi:hypothetical protein
MDKLLLCAVALVLMAVHAAAASPSGRGRLLTEDIGIATAETADAPLVLVQRRGGGGGGGQVQRGGGGANVNRANANRANVNRTNANRTNFNANNFQQNVTVNRNVAVSGGNYNSGPNWGGVAAGVAVGAGVTAMATAAANSASAPPPPPYPYDPYRPYGY